MSLLLPLSVVTRISSRSSEEAGRGCSEGMGVWARKTCLESILHTTPLNTDTVAENWNPVQQMGRSRSQEVVNKGCVLVRYLLNIFPKFWCCFMLCIELHKCCESCLACIGVWVMKLALSGWWTVGGSKGRAIFRSINWCQTAEHC